MAEGSESALILALRLKGRDGERGGGARGEKEKERATAMIRRDEEMSAQRVKGFMGEGGGVGKKNKKTTEGGLKSSRDAQREETLRMTQFITITATKEWGRGVWRGECKCTPLCTAIH